MITAPAPIDLSIAGLQRHYRNGDFTPRQLIATLRARGAQYRDHNVWIRELSDAELAPYLKHLEQQPAAALPLYGVPFAIKDNIDLAGIPTTAACPAYTYTPAADAPVVAALIAAGAIPLGKTNLDQFATGLVGTRSPWGPARNSFDPAYIAGGSSAGSALAVALGLASFALGTDTAGSGRVPAAFNNIVGLKPSRGLLSTRGVVPACRSLDCVSLFATSAVDLDALFAVSAQFDAADPFARRNPAHNSGSAFGAIGAPFVFGVPQAGQLEFFGDTAAAAAFAQSVTQLERLGGRARHIDFAPFLDAARLLYEGPWLAERYLTAGPLLERDAAAVLPVIATIVGAGRDQTATATFAALYRLQQLRRDAEQLLTGLDFVVTPTAGTLFSQAEVAAAPIARNAELGYYTNFMNLLDLAAVAVPAALLDSGLPFGVTLFADRHTDLRLLSYAHALQEALQLPLGATGRDYRATPLPARAATETVKVVVCGAHMAGLPLNGQLLARQGRLLASTTTAARYRLYALPGGAIRRPGLSRDDNTGRAIAVEVWEVPVAEFGSFVALIPQPLGIGKVELQDGSWLPGFICEHYALAGAEDISALGGWRAYLQRD